MNQQQLLENPTTFSDPEWENYLTDEKNKLLDEFETLGKEDALDGNNPKFANEYRRLTCEKAQAVTQTLIMENGARFTAHANLAIANQAKNDGYAALHPLKAEHRVERIELEKAKKDAKKNKPNRSKGFRLFILHCFSTIIALSDAVINYPVIRHIGFGKLASYVITGAVAVATFWGAYKLGAYIMAATNLNERIKRFFISLIPYVFGFTLLAIARADYFSYKPVYEDTVAAQPITLFQVVTIGTVSTLLFWLALYLYSTMALTEEEITARDIHAQKEADVKELEENHIAKSYEISSKEQAILDKAAIALARFEYARNIEVQLYSFAQELLIKYIVTNRKYRTDGITPEFFFDPYQFNFTSFFNNQKIKE